MSTGTQSGSISYTLSYKHGVDSKGRVQVPAKYRQGETTQFTLILWPPGAPPAETCLMALPPGRWEELKNKMAALPYADPEANRLRRWIGTHAEEVETDGAGRVNIPQSLADGAGLKKDALFVGMLDRFQIWDPERYRPIEEQDTALAGNAISRI